MRTIHLHGSLGQEFGHKIRLAVDTVQEAIDALQANFPRFFNAIRNGHFRVVVGKTQKDGLELEEAMLPGFKLGNQDLFIIPVIKGSKRGGLGKIIAGIALIGLSMMGGSRRLNRSQPTGYGLTTMNAPTWASAASHPPRN
ncbi:hypothetical protein MASR1M32_28890 [Rhodobacter sp.]